MIVAIDTSSSVTVIGTGTADAPGEEARVSGARRHAEAIDGLFAGIAPRNRSDIEAVAVGIGPGPYSGLRVGIAFGIGLGRALAVPVVGVCSLDVRAWQVGTGSTGELPADFSVVADARRGEVYWADYRRQDEGLPMRVAGPRVLLRDALPSVELKFEDVEIDAALMAHRVAQLREIGTPVVDPHAHLVPHGDDASSSTLSAGPLFVPTPLYLRQPDVTLSPITESKS